MSLKLLLICSTLSFAAAGSELIPAEPGFSRAALTEKVTSIQESLTHPVLIASAVVFTIFSTIDIVLSFLSNISAPQGTIKGNALSIFQKVLMFLFFNGVLDHFIEIAKPSKNPILARLNAVVNPTEDDTTLVATRRRRDIEEVSAAVMDAINKYSLI